jgi:glycosyltransferase involved in cell wall biosynthesis
MGASHRVYIATESPYSEYRLDYLARELSINLSGILVTTIENIASLGLIDIFVHFGNHYLPLLSPQGRRNLHVCRFPFPADDEYVAKTWENLTGYDRIVVCSSFAEEALRTRLSPFQPDVKVLMVPPPVPIPPASRTAKIFDKNKLRVVSVGRFFAGEHNKRHDVLITAVRRIIGLGVDAELDLAGSLHPDSVHIDHYNCLLREANGLPIRFHTNASPEAVRRLFQDADFYWHAAGFDVDPQLYPEQCEHFGISVLEAMAFGCVPLVVANGGPAQVVRDGESGFHYRTLEELVDKTCALRSDAAQMRTVSERARQEARRYDEAIFMAEWRKLATASFI